MQYFDSYWSEDFELLLSWFLEVIVDSVIKSQIYLCRGEKTFILLAMLFLTPSSVISSSVNWEIETNSPNK